MRHGADAIRHHADTFATMTMPFVSFVRSCARAALAIAVCAGAASAQVRDSSTVFLRPGDIVRINVWKHPEFSGDFVIAPDGRITHPQFRVIETANRPVSVVEEALRTYLASYESNPALTFSPLLRVFVGGNVRAPSMLLLPPGTSIAEALALAGGTTEDAELTKIRLLRNGSESVIDLHGESMASAAPVRSGDQIVVPRHRSFFRDVLVPAGSVIGALGALASIIIQLSR